MGDVAKWKEDVAWVLRTIHSWSEDEARNHADRLSESGGPFDRGLTPDKAVEEDRYYWDEWVEESNG